MTKYNYDTVSRWEKGKIGNAPLTFALQGRRE